MIQAFSLLTDDDRKDTVKLCEQVYFSEAETNMKNSFIRITAFLLAFLMLPFFAFAEETAVYTLEAKTYPLRRRLLRGAALHIRFRRSVRDFRSQAAGGCTERFLLQY